MSQETPQIPPFEDLLNQSQKDNLRRTLDQIPVQRRNLQKAKRAGIDVGDAEAELDKLERDINRLLAEL